MKNMLLLSLIATSLGLTLPGRICAEDAKPPAAETKQEHDARMAWWREAKFGMFIHWGVYSGPAGFYHDKPVPGIGEWIMNRGKIPMAEYQQLAKQFNPVKFNADDWMKTARDVNSFFTFLSRVSPQTARIPTTFPKTDYSDELL